MKSLRILELAILAAGAAHAGNASLSFVKPIDLPAFGIRVKLMPEAKEAPLPSPQVFKYRFTQGERAWEEERYDPIELWRNSQCGGMWVGRHDNALMLALMVTLPPDGFKDPPHITRAAYDQLVAATPAQPMDYDGTTLARWVAGFAGVRNPTPTAVKPPQGRISPIYRYSPQDRANSRLVYVFRINRVPGNAAAASWVCAVFDINPDIRSEAARRAIEKDFLGSITLLSLRSPTTGQNAGNPAVGRGAGDTHNNEQEDARKQAAESIRNMKGWWVDTTTHYVLLSNLKGNIQTLVGKIGKAMDLMRTAYAHFVPEPAHASASVIRMPATPEEYLSYVGKDKAWSAGLWTPGRKELLIRPITEGSSHDKRLALLRTAFHEGFHQYASQAFTKSELPIWLNEGYAQLFENSTLMNGGIRIGEAPHPAAIVEATIRQRRLDLERLFRLSAVEFYDRDADRLAENYAVAWAVVYYLAKGAPSEGKSHHADLLRSITESCLRGDTQTGTDFTGKPDMVRLQRDFEHFWLSTSDRASARRYNPLAKTATKENGK